MWAIESGLNVSKESVVYVKNVFARKSGWRWIRQKSTGNQRRFSAQNRFVRWTFTFAPKVHKTLVNYYTSNESNHQQNYFRSKKRSWYREKRNKKTAFICICTYTCNIITYETLRKLRCCMFEKLTLKSKKKLNVICDRCRRRLWLLCWNKNVKIKIIQYYDW